MNQLKALERYNSMKIHFVVAVDGNKHDHESIAKTIEKLGHELVTEHFLTRKLEEIVKESPAESELYAKKAQTWIKKADIVLFETTKPDVSVGYEVALALNMMKPVIVLYNEESGYPPHSLKGYNLEKLQVLGYNAHTLPEILELALEHASESADVRFNFFISPKIGSYLDWISKNKKIPRSVYLRKLIEHDMEDNDEFEQDLQI